MGPGVQEAAGARGGGPGLTLCPWALATAWRPTPASEQGERKQRSPPGDAEGTQRVGAGLEEPLQAQASAPPWACGLQGKGWSSPDSPGVQVGARSALGALWADGPGWLLTS